LRNVDPLMVGFCNVAEFLGLTVLLPRTSEQAAATYYVYSLIFFVASRFICTWLMKFIAPHLLLTLLAFIATACCIGTVYLPGTSGVYSLIGISACMSLMFPTIFGLGTRGLGDDVKMGGAGMVMAICGAAFLTQFQGYISDWFGIRLAYWVPAVAFLVIAYYAAVVCRNDDRFDR
jgi:FHS family L-fucose permease-like MFS transporter